MTIALTASNLQANCTCSLDCLQTTFRLLYCSIIYVLYRQVDYLVIIGSNGQILAILVFIEFIVFELKYRKVNVVCKRLC